MASADFCRSVPEPLGTGSTRQGDRSPRVMRVTFTLMPAAYTSAPSVQVSGFEDNGLLTRCDRLVCDSCSSGQCFACGFLQIPPRDGHPCRSANRSPCRAGRGLSPPSHRLITTTSRIAPVKALRAMPGAPQQRPPSQEDGPSPSVISQITLFQEGSSGHLPHLSLYFRRKRVLPRPNYRSVAASIVQGPVHAVPTGQM